MLGVRGRAPLVLATLRPHVRARVGARERGHEEHREYGAGPSECTPWDAMQMEAIMYMQS